MTQENTKKPEGALERLQLLEHELEHVKGLMNRDGQAFGFLAAQVQEVKQGLAGITKTLAAVIKELQSQKLVTDEGILLHIREIDEENEKARVADLLKSKAIQASDSVGAGSLVVISQKHVESTGKITVISDYQVLEMARLDPNSHSFKELIGKKSKDQFQIPTKENGFVQVNVVGVYDRAAQGGATLGEQPPTPSVVALSSDAQPEVTPTPAAEAAPAPTEPTSDATAAADATTSAPAASSGN